MTDREQPEALLLADVHEDGTEIGDKTDAELRRLHDLSAARAEELWRLSGRIAALEKALRMAVEALEDMKAEFRALDLPYGSKAYTKANDASHTARQTLGGKHE